MALEVLNVALAKALKFNPHLVYAVLERQQVFESLRTHQLFWDLIENIFVVVKHFGAGLHAHPSGATGGSFSSAAAPPDREAAEVGVWSVDKVRLMALAVATHAPLALMCASTEISYSGPAPAPPGACTHQRCCPHVEKRNA